MKVCFFTITSQDEVNQRYTRMMSASLKKFHPDIPHIIKPFMPDLNFRIYAFYGRELAKEYDLVINIDNDSIVTGSLNDILNDDSYDIGAVLNNNLVDPQLQMWDTPAPLYINAGLVAIRGKRLWDWWFALSNSYHAASYRFREQDMLNIIFSYGDCRTKIFDQSDSWYGLISKGRWNKIVLKDDKLFMPKKVIEEYNSTGYSFTDKDKEIKLIHWAGGQVPKMNYWPLFEKSVAERIELLVGGENGKH